jgi:hypothetical protein
MVKNSGNEPRPLPERSTSTDRHAARRARSCLVNSGQDTQITLHDGSTIVLKGITRLAAVFSAAGAASSPELSPIGGDIGGDC